MRVFLSPSTQTANLYAGGRGTEAEWCRRIAVACQEHLTAHAPILTTTIGTGTSATAQRDASNAWRADWHVSIHTDATVAHNVTRGSVVFWHPGSVKGERLARAISARLSAATDTNDRAPYARAGLTELAHTRAAAALVECQFHDTEAGAAEIVRSVTEYGQAIAEGIMDALNITRTMPPATTPAPAPAPAPDRKAAALAALAAAVEAVNAL